MLRSDEERCRRRAHNLGSSAEFLVVDRQSNLELINTSVLTDGYGTVVRVGDDGSLSVVCRLSLSVLRKKAISAKRTKGTKLRRTVRAGALAGIA